MSKNIVICCDGTGNRYGENNTNVVKIFERIRRDEPAPAQKRSDAAQIGYYDPGIGTFSAYGQSAGLFRRKLGKILGQAFGYGLRKNLADAMLYLMRHYEPGDAIYLFGFSRGAYTVRVLADIILKIGILQEGNGNLMPYVFEMYFNRKKELKQETIDGFSQAFCKKPDKIKFIGVFDTVSSLGRLLSRNYRHLSGEIRPDVDNAFHAVAIDEKRKKFPVSLFRPAEDAPLSQTLKEVWFAGVHSDVGGYYPKRGLSDITLEWMLLNATGCGLVLEKTAREGIKPEPEDELHKSRTGFWRVWRPVHRQIPDGASVHRSVLDRRDNPATEYSSKLKLPVKFDTVETPDWPRAA